MKKIILTVGLLFIAFISNAQLSPADQCEVIAQEAGCEAYENGWVTWAGHYAIIDSVYATCMSQHEQ